MELIFEDPPTPTGARMPDPYEATLAQALREHPGRFVRMDKKFSSSAAQNAAATIKKGTRKAFRDGGYDAVARMVAGTPVVYVKYVGQSE